MDADKERIQFRCFQTEEDLLTVIGLIEKELSEPYPIYTYRYFVHKWPDLTIMAFLDGKCIGCIVSKLEEQVKQYWRTKKMRGYIAMLAVHPDYRRLGLGTYAFTYSLGRKLVKQSIDKMKEQGADEIVLETEITNQAALRLYECRPLFWLSNSFRIHQRQTTCSVLPKWERCLQAEVVPDWQKL